jgi:type VI secretion system Hcp family effector
MVVCALVAGMVALPAPARAWQSFAKLTTSTGTIDGDATAKGFEKQIVVVGLGNRIEGGGVIKQLGNLVMVKGFDVATPKIVVAVATSQVLPKVEITLFKTTPTGSVPGFKITLTTAVIVRLDTEYDPGADPSTIEKLEIQYGQFLWTDLITGATGSAP